MVCFSFSNKHSTFTLKSKNKNDPNHKIFKKRYFCPNVTETFLKFLPFCNIVGKIKVGENHSEPMLVYNWSDGYFER